MPTPVQRIDFGGDYNPEQWPEEVWTEDLHLMKEAGVTMVTAGIFSWAKVEPRPDEWDFGWFDRVMGNMADAGIDVCLATMTASPPPWMSHRHPEILPVTAEGRVMHPGSRQHYCPSSPVYRSYARRLVERLATRYADHPALAMWHIGNEYGCHTKQCYCEVSAADFRRWLHDRYGSVDALNDAWSTAFWAQAYSSFDEVLPPRSAPAIPNPAQQLDYWRFSNDALLGCHLTEKEALNEITPGVPVTTNFMAHHKPVNQFEWAGHEDVVSLDFYQDPHDPRTHLHAALTFDLMRSAGGGNPWMLLEQAPSAVNWRQRNGPKPPGAMRLWSWQAVAQGSDSVIYFQWRQSRGGAEKFHSAMVPHGGTGTRTFREVCELGREPGSVAELAGTRVRQPEVGLVQDWNSRWALELEARPSTALQQPELMLAHHRPLWEANVPTDVVPPDRSLSPYRLVVVPNLYMMSEETGRRLTEYVRAGGHLLVSFFSGIVDESDRIHPGGYPGPLREVLGLRVEEFWPMAARAKQPVRGGPVGETEADLWSEVIHLEGAEAVARFSGGELDGLPAVTRHVLGAGTAWYVGTRLPNAAMRSLMDSVREGAGVEPVLPGLPAGVQTTVREAPGREDGAGSRYVFLLNHGAGEAEVQLPYAATDLLTGRSVAAGGRINLEPRGVAVLR